MKLSGISRLYRSMKDKKIDRYRFHYKHGRVLFDVFFFIDDSPFNMLFGAKGSSFSFDIEVKPGFYINPTLDSQTYKELCKLLGLEYDPDNPFSPKVFFEDFNEEIPPYAKAEYEAKPQDIAQYRRNVDEADKKYFLGWRNNDVREENVTESNLAKTKMLLGDRAYKICATKNISSCWSDNSAKAKKVRLPH